MVVTSPSIIWSVHSSLSPDRPILLSLVPHPFLPNPLPPGEETKISKARSNASGYKIIWTHYTHSHTNLQWKCISLWDKAGQQPLSVIFVSLKSLLWFVPYCPSIGCGENRKKIKGWHTVVLSLWPPNTRLYKWLKYSRGMSVSGIQNDLSSLLTSFTPSFASCFYLPLLLIWQSLISYFLQKWS